MADRSPRFNDPIVDEILTDTIIRGEYSFGWIRMLAAIGALIQIWVLFGPSWLDPSRLDVLSGVLGGTVVASAVLLRRLKTHGLSTPLLVSSLAIDRLGIFACLLCLMLWPAEAYPGLARIPEIGFVFIVTVAAGLRLAARLAMAAALFDLALTAALLRIDRFVHPDRVVGTPANELMVLLVLAVCGGLAWTISSRSAKLVSRGAAEARGAEQVRQRLGAYVSTELLDIVLSEGNDKLGGRRQTVVILFSDLRGFTQYSEGHDPEALVDELNRYFEAMLEPIQLHGGVVDKFMGDAIMAVWGVPEGRSDDAMRAMKAANGMGNALIEHNRSRVAQGLEPLAQGIGLHLGEVVAGNIGTLKRRQYTVVGDAVNIASRLESLTKEHRVPVLVSDSVVQAAGGPVVGVEHRGTVTVRGRTEPVDVFSLRETGGE